MGFKFCAGARCKNVFDGFTFYPDTTTEFATTYPSIALALTGKYYDNSVPFQGFLRQASVDDSIAARLKAQGYDINLPLASFMYLDDSLASNIRKKKLFSTVGLREIAEFIDVGLLQVSPHYLKRLCFDYDRNLPIYFGNLLKANADNSADFKHPGIELMNATLKNFSLIGNQGSFKLLYFTGVRSPLLINSNLQLQVLLSTFDGIVVDDTEANAGILVEALGMTTRSMLP